LSFVINILIYTIYLGGPLGAMGGMPRSLRPDVTVGDIRDPRMMQQGPRGIAPQRPAAPSAAGALSSLMVSNKYISVVMYYWCIFLIHYLHACDLKLKSEVNSSIYTDIAGLDQHHFFFHVHNLLARFIFFS
jgi:hypothetical protein